MSVSDCSGAHIFTHAHHKKGLHPIRQNQYAEKSHYGQGPILLPHLTLYKPAIGTGSNVTLRSVQMLFLIKKSLTISITPNVHLPVLPNPWALAPRTHQTNVKLITSSQLLSRNPFPRPVPANINTFRYGLKKKSYKMTCKTTTELSDLCLILNVSWWIDAHKWTVIRRLHLNFEKR